MFCILAQQSAHIGSHLHAYTLTHDFTHRSDLKAAAHVEVQKLERELVNLEKALTERVSSACIYVCVCLFACLETSCTRMCIPRLTLSHTHTHTHQQHITRRELTEQRVSVLQNEIAQVEKRILQYGAGTLISLLTVGLGFARLVM